MYKIMYALSMDGEEILFEPANTILREKRFSDRACANLYLCGVNDLLHGSLDIDSKYTLVYEEMEEQ